MEWLARFFDESDPGWWGTPLWLRWWVRIVVLGAIAFLGYAAVTWTL